jgi:hypothetical protein
MMGRLKRASVSAIDALGVQPALELQPPPLRARQLLGLDGAQRVRADRERLGKAQGAPVGRHDRHVVGEEAAAVLAQQPQHRGGLAGVGQRREHDADAVELDARGVQQHPAARHHDEAQQGLDDVRVDDVRRARQQGPDLDHDRLAQPDEEVGAEPAEVLLVAHGHGLGVLRHGRASAGDPAADVPDPDGDVDVGAPGALRRLREDPRARDGWIALEEGAAKAALALTASVPAPREVLVAGRLASAPGVLDALAERLQGVAPVRSALAVKSAARGAALLADGLAGGRYAPLVARLRLREARGGVLDHLRMYGAERIALG